jgi:hypothetical protein
MKSRHKRKEIKKKYETEQVKEMGIENKEQRKKIMIRV